MIYGTGSKPDRQETDTPCFFSLPEPNHSESSSASESLFSSVVLDVVGCITSVSPPHKVLKLALCLIAVRQQGLRLPYMSTPNRTAPTTGTDMAFPANLLHVEGLILAKPASLKLILSIGKA